MRDTARKRAILQFLETVTEADYLEFGPPPYNAALITRHIGGSLPSVARTLRTMAKDGQLVAVKHKDDVFNAIAQTFIPMTVTAYYSASTMDHDMAAAKLWRDGAGERSDKALAGIMEAFSR
jgi:hypothetical protein